MRAAKKSIYILMMVLLILIGSSVFLLFKDSGENAPDVSSSIMGRSIYIGDVITIRISKNEVTENDIREAFSEFDIVDVKDQKGVYNLKIRSFDVGEKTVVLKGQEINIVVSSILESDSRGEIYDGDYRLIEPGMNIYWVYILYVSIALCIISVAYTLLKMYKKVENRELSSYEQVTQWIFSLSVNEDDYFVKLSYYLKWYIEKTLEIKAVGKTSRELITDLIRNKNFTLDYHLMTEWLNKCDYIKFSGKEFLENEREEMKALLISIIDSIQSVMMIEEKIEIRKDEKLEKNDEEVIEC